MNGLMVASAGVLASILVSTIGVSAQTTGAPSQESVSRYCAALSETARLAARGFYLGIAFDDTLAGYEGGSSAWSNDLTKQVVELAYALPAPTGNENMAHVIHQFSEDIHVQCYGLFGS